MIVGGIKRNIGKKAAVILISLLPALMLWALVCVNCEALGTSGNVTAECVTKDPGAGDEVRIEVSTCRMNISTFIASVEYDPSDLEYKGYEGTAGKSAVYLTDASDSELRFDITVEQSETDPVIGMYAIGTTDRKYAAAKPLVTLLFKSKKGGKPQFKVTESTAGKDGYTSEEIEEMSAGPKVSEEGSDMAESAAGADDQAGDDGAREQNSSLAGPLLILLSAGALMCVVFIMMRNRKDD